MTEKRIWLIYNDSSVQNPALLELTSEEVEKLYQLLKNEIVRASTHGPYRENYRWPLFDRVAELKGNVNDSHDEYEYWRDWLDKNRDDLYEDRYADREEDDE